MNLYDILKEKDEVVSIEYYSRENFGFKYNFQMLIDRYNDIKKYFEEEKCDDEFNCFVDYLVCSEFSNYNKDKDYLIREGFAHVEDVLTLINNVLKQKSPKDYRNYLEGGDDFYSRADFQLKQLCYKFIKNHKGVVTETLLKKAIQHTPYYFLEDFKSWIKFFIAFELTDCMVDQVSSLSNTQLDELLQYVKTLNDNGYDIGNYVKQLNTVLDECLNASEGQVLHAKIKYTTILSYYNLIKITDANKYNDLLIEMEKKEKKWMDVNGQDLGIDLKYEEGVHLLNSIKHPGLQILFYSHDEYQFNNKSLFLSFFESAKRVSVQNGDMLIDLCKSTTITSNKYSEWLQLCYSLGEAYHSNMLLYAFQTQDLREKYFVGTKVFCSKIFQKFSERHKLLEDFDNLQNKMRDCLLNINDNKAVKEFSKFTIEFIEDCLRELYYDKNKDVKYINKDQLTLGSMLKSDKKYFENIFMDDFIDGLNFYLSCDTNEHGEKIGFDLRNRMHHANKMSDKEYDAKLFIRISLLLTTFINELYIYVTTSEQ